MPSTKLRNSSSPIGKSAPKPLSPIRCGRMQTTRTPYGPSSAASVRDNPSTAAQATPNPPVRAIARRAGDAVIVRMTPLARLYHVPRRRASRQKLGRCPRADWKGEVAQRKLGERSALNDRKSNGVEANVDAACPIGDLVRVPLPLVVQRIHLRRRGQSTGCGDFPGNGLYRAEIPTAQEDSGAFPREGPSHRTSDRSARPVDDGRLVR